MTVLLAVTACSLAVAATPALAHEFVASKEGKTHGTTESTQLLKFGPFKVTCLKASANGFVAAGPSKTYATVVKFGKCQTRAQVGVKEIKLATKFLKPLAIEYHANGFTETGGELEEEEGKAVIGGGSAELKINTGQTEEFKKSECHVSWPAQSLPLKGKTPEEEFSYASFSNEEMAHKMSAAFPDGIQHFITINNALKGIKVTFEGEPCEEWGKQGGEESTGQYTGSFPQILYGGNLEFF
jgi:hypothetical protein